jgi:uncharacterized repeat protein (TIGR03803 family)
MLKLADRRTMTPTVRAMLRFGCALVATLAIDITPAFARAYSVLYAFQPPPREPSGKLLELADGFFLGTSQRGGAFNQGSIYLLYRRADNTWSTFVVHSFSGPDGRWPAAGIMRASDGNFYGTTTVGGAHDEGTVFRLSQSGRVTVVHSFSRPNGAEPSELLIEAPDGSLWSTTANGGRPSPEFGFGTIFRITKAGSLTTMHRFNVDDGQYPNALVDGGDGFFYGTTLFGGADPDSAGTLFRIDVVGALTTLHDFSHDIRPSDLTIGTDGFLYASSTRGGIVTEPGGDGVGVVFRATRGGAVTAIHNFSFDEGIHFPVGGVVQGPDGALYGGTFTGATGPDVMYRLTLDGTVSKLADLGIPFGRDPSGLTIAANGTIIATTRTGGVPFGTFDAGNGVAFTLSAATATMLYSFSPPTPLGPTGRLTEGPDGTLYGTSCGGGIYNAGTVFKFRGGVVETIHSFNGLDGHCPFGGVTFGADGLLYGTTFSGVGGTWPGLGTVFRTATTAGAFSTLWSGVESGPRNPMSSPTIGPDGNLYVTASSLTILSGAVLRVSLDGAVTVLAPIELEDGRGIVPIAPVTFASDGQAYGTTSRAEGSGVYRMGLDGTLSTVAAMSGPGADWVFRWGLVEGSPGTLIGVESNGGAAGVGRVFAVSTVTGATSPLHDFTPADGISPIGELIDVGAGQFVGVTGGSKYVSSGQFGTIYRVTAAGLFTTLHRFSWLDGANPASGLLRSADGSLYGTTQSGGFGGGVIYKLTP